ncbi:MAG: pseudoazurin [Pseudomonadota bacterium]
MSEQEEQSDAYVIKMMSIVMGALVAMAVVIFVAAGILGATVDKSDDAYLRAQLAERLAPVGQLQTTLPDPADAAPTGQEEVVAVNLPEPAPGGTTHTVKMLNAGADGQMVFEPAYLQAQPGDVVVFEAADASHNSRSVLVPDGAEDWTGGMSETVAVRLDEEGVYIYVCDPHLTMAMVGVIQVGAPSNLDAAQAKAAEMEGGFMMAQGRLTGYMEQVDPNLQTVALVESDTAEPQAEATTEAETESAAQPVAAAAPTTHRIKMLNSGADGAMVFEPAFVQAQVGDTVIFEPTDLAHNSRAVLVPDGADAWTGELSKEISVTLDTEGVYIYVCDPHLVMAMVGVIQVGAANNLDAARAKADELEGGFIMANGRLNGYLDRVDTALQSSAGTEVETAADSGDTDAAGSDASASAGPTEHRVKMLNTGADGGSMVFEPAFVRAQVGDTVVFEPTDPAHNSRSVLVPDGADSWSGALNEEVSITLDAEGVYIYVCDPHSIMAMVGVIQVGAATNLDAAMAKAEELEGGFALSKGRLNEYMLQVN